MKKSGMFVLAFASGFIVLGASCNSNLGPVPVHQALISYFKGGYVPYALPGTGTLYEPGAIIRYEKGAEVPVRARTDCFDLPTVPNTSYSPKTEWSSDTDFSAAL